MFGIGMPEFLLILVVALVVFGPKKLPELARTIGRALAEFKKSADELKENLNVGEELKDVQKDFKDMVDPSKILYPSEITPPHKDDNQENARNQPFPGNSDGSDFESPRCLTSRCPLPPTWRSFENG